MRKKIIRSGALVLALISIFQVAAFAEAVEGRVSSVSYENLDMIIYDAQGRPYPNTLRLAFDDRTQVSGAKSIADLRPNDPIGANIHQQETGAWHADTVTVFQQVNAQPATKQPSNALKDMLGTPVVRGALLGAATGAIASSASGGKAGKGALYGAAAGAGFSLLEGMFSQKSNRQSDSDSQ